MQQFLRLAGQHPDRIGIALHEYSYVQDNLDRFYPDLVGRFQMLYAVCDANGIPRPKVLVTEFGWVYDDIAHSVDQAMNVDLPWAAELYARYPGGGTADEVFAYRDGGWSDNLRRWFFVKNTGGENWEEFGYDGRYIYRYRDSSWANTCQDGAAAFYQVTDENRAAFARWLPRTMQVGDIWTSTVSHFVDAGYKRTNGCRTDICSSVYEGWVTNRMQLVAHHSTYTTIWGYRVNDVVELTDPYNAASDHFFYARGYGLVGFEGPAGNDQGRFASGAYHIEPNAGGRPAWVGLCE